MILKIWRALNIYYESRPATSGKKPQLCKRSIEVILIAAGFAYLAVVINLYSRHVVGSAMGKLPRQCP